jgi:hypothetical protein
MTKEKQEEIIMKLKELLEELSFEYWKDNNKDYKYKKDEWEEILKGNDYY